MSALAVVAVFVIAVQAGVGAAAAWQRWSRWALLVVAPTALAFGLVVYTEPRLVLAVVGFSAGYWLWDRRSFDLVPQERHS